MNSFSPHCFRRTQKPARPFNPWRLSWRRPDSTAYIFYPNRMGKDCSAQPSAPVFRYASEATEDPRGHRRARRAMPLLPGAMPWPRRCFRSPAPPANGMFPGEFADPHLVLPSFFARVPSRTPLFRSARKASHPNHQKVENLLYAVVSGFAQKPHLIQRRPKRRFRTNRQPRRSFNQTAAVLAALGGSWGAHAPSGFPQATSKEAKPAGLTPLHHDAP